MLADEFAGGCVQRHGRRAHRGDQFAAGKRRVGRVGMLSVELDLALLVSLGTLIAHDVEWLLREARHGELVLHEQLLLRLAFEVVLLGQPHAHGRQLGVVLGRVGHVGDGHEQVGAEIADLGLDGSLLMARIRAAEREREVVVGRERAEQLCSAHSLADAAAHTGRVVEHDAPGHAADELEDIPERLAYALGVLAREDLRDADVGVREREHEVAQAHLDAADGEVRLAEVGLSLARRPALVQVVVCVGMPELLAQRSHVSAHGRFADLDALLGRQAHPDAVRGVALLAPLAAVALEPTDDERTVRVEYLRALLDGGHLRRQVIFRQAVVHRVAAYSHLAGYLGHRLSLLLQLPYRIRL